MKKQSKPAIVCNLFQHDGDDRADDQLNLIETIVLACRQILAE